MLDVFNAASADTLGRTLLQLKQERVDDIPLELVYAVYALEFGKKCLDFAGHNELQDFQEVWLLCQFLVHNLCFLVAV